MKYFISLDDNPEPAHMIFKVINNKLRMISTW
jgi:hypothetical protein